MDLWEVRHFDDDDIHTIKICLKQDFLSTERLQSLLQENTDKQLMYVLADNRVLTQEQLSQLLDLRKKSVLCPTCQALNFVKTKDSYLFCDECHQFVHLRQLLEKDKASTTSNLQRYGNYRILGEIGQGSMGIVYKALHIKLERHAAVKVLKSNMSNPNLLAYFMREARSAASLQHPNIVAIYDVDEVHGQPYIAMEYVEGKRLGELISTTQSERNTFSLQDKIKIVIQIAHGLQHAHEKKIIHRDIKPDNIMITRDFQVKITDFGLAKEIQQATASTNSNQLMGTPLYMSPEQIEGNLPLNASTDIYSLGVVFYEMLTGRPPFYHSSLAPLFQKILHDTPIRPREIRPDIPVLIDNICLNALAKDPQARFHSAEEMAQALENALAVLQQGLTPRQGMLKPPVSDPPGMLSKDPIMAGTPSKPGSKPDTTAGPIQAPSVEVPSVEQPTSPSVQGQPPALSVQPPIPIQPVINKHPFGGLVEPPIPVEPPRPLPVKVPFQPPNASVKPVPEPIVKPVPEPIVKPVPEPMVKPVPEPMAKPAPEPMVKPVPELIAKPVPEPMVKPAPPVMKHVQPPVQVPQPVPPNIGPSRGTSDLKKPEDRRSIFPPIGKTMRSVPPNGRQQGASSEAPGNGTTAKEFQAAVTESKEHDSDGWTAVDLVLWGLSVLAILYFCYHYLL